MDYESIIDKYYKGNGKLKDILLRHSKAVAQKALAIADAHPELHLDRQFIIEAAMVHDIGIPTLPTYNASARSRTYATGCSARR